MAITLDSCKLRVRTQYGTSESGTVLVKSYTLDGVLESADSAALMKVSDAVGTLTDYPVIETLRIDENVITSDDEE